MSLRAELDGGLKVVVGAGVILDGGGWARREEVGTGTGGAWIHSGQPESHYESHNSFRVKETNNINGQHYSSEAST